MRITVQIPFMEELKTALDLAVVGMENEKSRAMVRRIASVIANGLPELITEVNSIEADVGDDTFASFEACLNAEISWALAANFRELFKMCAGIADLAIPKAVDELKRLAAMKG